MKAFFFLTIGPPLPIKLAGHSILEINGDLFVFGGQDDTGNPQSAIYKLSCGRLYGPLGCIWDLGFNQSLKVARPFLVAIPVPDRFCA